MQEKKLRSFIPKGLNFLQVFGENFMSLGTTNTAPTVSSEVLNTVDGLHLLK